MPFKKEFNDEPAGAVVFAAKTRSPSGLSLNEWFNHYEFTSGGITISAGTPIQPSIELLF